MRLWKPLGGVGGLQGSSAPLLGAGVSSPGVPSALAFCAKFSAGCSSDLVLP